MKKYPSIRQLIHLEICLRQMIYILFKNSFIYWLQVHLAHILIPLFLSGAWTPKEENQNHYYMLGPWLNQIASLFLRNSLKFSYH